MELIPAIDLLGGRVVRLSKGAYDAVTEYDDDPVAVARGFATQGAERIHIVDLEAARLLTYQAAQLKDVGAGRGEISRAAAMAKLFASEAAVRATRTATVPAQRSGSGDTPAERPIQRRRRK